MVSTALDAKRCEINMAYSGTVAARPASIDGCLQTFSMSYLPSVLRTESENSAFIKTRRLTTKPVKIAECGLTLPAALVADFIAWFEVNCQCGAIPTRIKLPPNGVEEIWRFASDPSINCVDNIAAEVSWSMEQLPFGR